MDQRAYEQISNLAPARAEGRAKEILRDGWYKRDYDVLNLSEPIPWALTDTSLRSWNFNIHCLDMIDALLAAHSQTGDLKYLTPALRIGLDWIERHPRERNDMSPMAWYDMAVGLRAYRLGYLFQAAIHAGLLDTAAHTRFWSSLLDHCSELLDDEKIAFHNNHGYFQVAGQLALGRRFADVSAPMAALQAQGAQRLKRMLDQQFSPDGVHREHSPDYHRMVADTLLGLVRAGLVVDPDLLGRVDGIEEALAWFVTPNGTITNFGDSDSRSMVYSAEGAARKWTTPMMRAVASNGATGNGWPKGLRVFSDTGYAVVRQPDPAQPAEITADSYLAQTAAFHSRTHKHCDDLSFVWHDAGQSLLVDAGRYGYIGKTETGSDLWQDGFWYSDPMRVFMESSRAHNTLEFNGVNSLRKGVKPYGSALVQACSRQGLFWIETRCKQHRNIWHDRVLVFSPRCWLLVFDVYTDSLKAPHEVRQWFHLAPGHNARPVVGGYDAVLAGGGEMAIRNLIGDAMTGSVIRGRMDSPIQGWFSDKECSALAADALCFSQTGQSTGVMATLLTLSPGGQVASGPSRSNVTGRKAQVSWTDRFGKHALNFDRTGQLSLSYDFISLAADLVSDETGNLDTLLTRLRGVDRVLDHGATLAAALAARPGKMHIVAVCYTDAAARTLSELDSRVLARLTVIKALNTRNTMSDQRNAAAQVWQSPALGPLGAIIISGADAIACLSEAQARITASTTIVWRHFREHPAQENWRRIMTQGQEIGDAFVFDIFPRTSTSASHD